MTTLNQAMQAHLKIEDSITAINTPYHTIMGKFMLKCLFIIPLELLGQFYWTTLSHFNESCLNAIQVDCAGCLSARPICSRSNQHCKAAQRHRLRVSGIESEWHFTFIDVINGHLDQNVEKLPNFGKLKSFRDKEKSI